MSFRLIFSLCIVFISAAPALGMEQQSLSSFKKEIKSWVELSTPELGTKMHPLAKNAQELQDPYRIAFVSHVLLAHACHCNGDREGKKQNINIAVSVIYN